MKKITSIPDILQLKNIRVFFEADIFWLNNGMVEHWNVDFNFNKDFLITQYSNCEQNSLCSLFYTQF